MICTLRAIIAATVLLAVTSPVYAQQATYSYPFQGSQVYSAPTYTYPSYYYYQAPTYTYPSYYYYQAPTYYNYPASNPPDQHIYPADSSPTPGNSPPGERYHADYTGDAGVLDSLEWLGPR